MYAVIETGGKQYRVELGAELELDQLSADPGQTIELGRVLLVADGDEAMIGQPVVEGAKVTGEVMRPTRGEKLVVFKYRPKARRRVKHGHRQELTLVRVADIEFGGRSAAKEAQARSAEEQKERAAAAKAAEAKAKADQELAAKLAADRKAEAKADRAEKATAKGATKAAAKPVAKASAKTTKPAPPKKSTTSAKPAAGTRSKKKEE